MKKVLFCTAVVIGIIHNPTFYTAFRDPHVYVPVAILILFGITCAIWERKLNTTKTT